MNQFYRVMKSLTDICRSAKSDKEIADFVREMVKYYSKPNVTSLEPLENDSEMKNTFFEVLMRFPKQSPNHRYVEAMIHNNKQKSLLNLFIKKYNFTISDCCRILDEEGVFTKEGELNEEVIFNLGNLLYKSKKDIGSYNLKVPEGYKPDHEFALDVPDILVGQLDKDQYNYILLQESYIILLELVFRRGTIPNAVLDTFSMLDLNYKLPEPVINVLIHYLLANKRSWGKSSIEYTATDMIVNQVSTFEEAVTYVHSKNDRSKGNYPKAKDMKKPEIITEKQMKYLSQLLIKAEYSLRCDIDALEKETAGKLISHFVSGEQLTADIENLLVKYENRS